MRYFTLDDALALLPEARRRIGEVAGMVAELQAHARAIEAGTAAAGEIPEAKALEARIDDRLSWFRAQGVQVKSIAPALLDFPAAATVAGERREVLLCWREGEEEIAFYHPTDTGYLGRTPAATADDI
jgi:hypothetical protein